jgi:hypothetical protein
MDQYYVFIRPGTDEAWCEMFYDGDQHVTAPTPYFGPDAVRRAIARLKTLHPDAMVDELLPADFDDALRHCMA